MPEITFVSKWQDVQQSSDKEALLCWLFTARGLRQPRFVAIVTNQADGQGNYWLYEGEGDRVAETYGVRVVGATKVATDQLVIDICFAGDRCGPTRLTIIPELFCQAIYPWRNNLQLRGLVLPMYEVRFDESRQALRVKKRG